MSTASEAVALRAWASRLTLYVEELLVDAVVKHVRLHDLILGLREGQLVGSGGPIDQEMREGVVHGHRGPGSRPAGRTPTSVENSRGGPAPTKPEVPLGLETLSKASSPTSISLTSGTLSCTTFKLLSVPLVRTPVRAPRTGIVECFVRRGRGAARRWPQRATGRLGASKRTLLPPS